MVDGVLLGGGEGVEGMIVEPVQQVQQLHSWYCAPSVHPRRDSVVPTRTAWLANAGP